MFENLSHACNNNPKNGQAFRYRGQAFLYMQEYKRALFDFSAAIHAETSYDYEQVPDKNSPQDSKASRLGMCYNFAGQANHALGQFDEALAHYNVADKHMKGLKSNSMNEDSLRSDILFNRG